MAKSKKVTLAVITVFIVSGLILGGIFADQLWRFTSDIVANISYAPTSEVEEIVEKIGLTDRAKFIFGGAQPEIEERDDFNANCESHNEEISTLGCYTESKIHIYNVTADELDGIKESTAAHELLHAVWARLSSDEKTDLKNEILSVYHDEKYHDDFADELKTYDNDEIIEELHSRLATEVRDLPKKLEEHYAKYFKDQDHIVAFYDNYREPFKRLENEITAMEQDLKEKKATIEALEKEYADRSEEFGRVVDEFNNCADTINCFATESAFNNRRSQLIREQSSLDEMYDNLAKLVDEYNVEIEEYNNNVLRSQKLDSMMNSNSKVEEI